MKKLDIASWKRREQYLYFGKMDYPQFNVCANVDISRLLPAVKENSLSFYHVMVYLATRSATVIPEFLYRIRGNEVVVHESLCPSFTVPVDADTFSFVTVPYSERLDLFLATIREKLDCTNGRVELTEEAGKDDMLYISCLPWISFTSVSHPMSLTKEDSIPRLTWGKYYSDGGKTLLPFSVQVNHALMDGVHVGRYFGVLQALADSPGLYLPTA